MNFDSASEQAVLRGLVLDAMHDGALAIDRKQTIVYVNRAICQRSGYQREMLIGEPVHILLPEELRDIHQQHVHNFSLSAQQRTMACAGVLSMRCADGSTISVQIALGHERHPVHGLFMVATLRWL